MIYIITLLFFIMPILTIPLILIGICVNKKKRLWLLFLLAIVIAIFSYFLVTPDTYDLAQYIRVMERYKNINSIEETFKDDYEVLFCIILYTISRIGNYKLLSSIFTLFSYFTIFYIIDKYSKKIELSKIHTFIVLLFFLLTFNYTYFASGLRNATGYIIAILAIYLEYVEEKRGFFYKLLYIIPAFLHKSLFVIIIFRLMMIFDYKKIKKIYIPLMICMFFSGNLIINLSGILSSIPILSSLQERAIGYIQNRGSIFASGISIYNICIAIFTAILYIYNKLTNRNNINIKLYEWISAILILVIAMSSYSIIFSRFVSIFNLMSIFIICDFLKNEKHKTNYTCALIGIFAILFVGGISQYITLRTITFGNLLSEGLTKNIFSLFLIE